MNPFVEALERAERLLADKDAELAKCRADLALWKSRCEDMIADIRESDLYE